MTKFTIVGFYMKKLSYMTQVSDVAPGPLVQLYNGGYFLLVKERTWIFGGETTDLPQVN
jgi:hypothetical protein